MLLQQVHRLVQCAEEKVTGRPYSSFPTLDVVYKRAGRCLFTWASSAETRVNGFKLKTSEFRLNSEKKFFALRFVRHFSGTG